MIKYHISFEKPWQHQVQFNAQFDCSGKQVVTLQLPIWRPGRYELGNFAKYLLNIEFKNENGEELKFCSKNNHSWDIQCKGSKSIH
ncbi:MAG: hypothetical protein ACPGED_08020, partial [Flavobacteriales bacterium]